jgi:hypothetical protein
MTDTCKDKQLPLGRRILIKYPDRVPIIVHTNKIVEHDEVKFICPYDMTMAEFQIKMRTHPKFKSTKLYETETIYIFVDNKLLRSADVIGDVYYQYKNMDDECLHITIAKENVFG